MNMNETIVVPKKLNLNTIRKSVLDTYGKLDPLDEQVLSKIKKDQGAIRTSIVLNEVGKADFVAEKIEKHRMKGVIQISPTVVKKIREDEIIEKLVEEANKNFSSIFKDIVR